MPSSSLPVVEPAIVQTRLVSGVLKPVQNGHNWIITIIERRHMDGQWCNVVIERFAIAEADLVAALEVVMTPLKTKVFAPVLGMN